MQYTYVDDTREEEITESIIIDDTGVTISDLSSSEILHLCNKCNIYMRVCDMCEGTHCNNL